MCGRKEIPDTYGEATQECKEAQLRYGQLTEELGRKIGLSIGFDGLGSKLPEFGKDKEWYSSRVDGKRREIDTQLPKITEEGGK